MVRPWEGPWAPGGMGLELKLILTRSRNNLKRNEMQLGQGKCKLQCYSRKKLLYRRRGRNECFCLSSVTWEDADLQTGLKSASMLLQNPACWVYKTLNCSCSFCSRLVRWQHVYFSWFWILSFWVQERQTDQKEFRESRKNMTRATNYPWWKALNVLRRGCKRDRTSL